MANYRRRKAQRSWGGQFDNDLVSPEKSMKLVWEAVSVRGMDFVDVARVVGTTRSTVADIYYSRRKRVTREMEQRIVVALSSQALGRRPKPHDTLETEPYRWMMYGLHAQGWRQQDLQQILLAHGKTAGWVRWLAVKPLVRRRSIEDLKWLVHHVGDKRGPSKSNRALMQTLGHFPLIHYTEEGDLIESSLLPEQRAALRRIQSKHGRKSSGGHGPRPHP